MPVYVQLRAAKLISVGGTMKTYRPGDWVKIGKQTAQLWIAAGEATDPLAGTASVKELGQEVGIAFTGDAKAAGEYLKAQRIGIQIQQGVKLPWPRTLIWQVGCGLWPGLVGVGFKLLKTWQVAIPLCRYDILTRDVGTPEDRAATEAIVHDLRVPLYEVRQMYMQCCDDTRRLLDVWDEEQARVQGGDVRLAFLRALFTVKPFVLALPCSWVPGSEPKTTEH